MKPSIQLATTGDQSIIIPLANKVYYDAERDFWKEGYYRIDEPTYREYIENEWLFVAKDNENILGCILLKPVDSTTTSFSMLICHPDHRKKGIASALVDFAMEKARKDGFEKMQLEILSPLDWVHAEKEFLKTWYGSMGFQLIREVDFLDYYPGHDRFMKCPLVFSLYEKEL